MATKQNKEVIPKQSYKRKFSGDIVESGNITEDMVKLLNMGVDCLKKKHKPCIYSNDEQGLQAFENDCIAYFKHIAELNEGAEKPICPDIESLCVYLGMARKTLWGYQTSRGLDWVQSIENVKNIIASAKKQMAFSGKIPPLIAIFDLTNNHGYLNSSEFRLTGVVEQEKPIEALPDLLSVLDTGEIKND